MDCSSINLIDLQFFSNPLAMQKINKSVFLKETNKAELDFYRLRIFDTARQILQGKEVDSKLKHLFDIFSYECIQYFKFIDKSDLIQNEFEKNNKKESQPKKPLKDISGADYIMIKKKNVKIPKITDYLKIKTTIIKKKRFIPKDRNINLKDPKYKTKGVKKNEKI